jgi:hypothetical protein
VLEFLVYKSLSLLWSFYENYNRAKSGRVYRTSRPRVQKKSEPALCILKEVDGDLPLRWGGFMRLLILGNYDR